MSMTVPAMATARRNVVERIARFLDDLERDGREPRHWQGSQVRAALSALERGNYPAGEDAMMRAERPAFSGPRSLQTGGCCCGKGRRSRTCAQVLRVCKPTTERHFVGQGENMHRGGIPFMSAC